MNNIDNEAHNNQLRKKSILRLVGINDNTVRNIINLSVNCNDVEKNECSYLITIQKKNQKALSDYSDIRIKNTIENFIENDANILSVYTSDFERPTALSHGRIEIHFFKKT